MTTPGRLHLTATLVLLVSLIGIGVAQAGVLETPTGGLGVMDRPDPDPRADWLAPEPVSR